MVSILSETEGQPATYPAIPDTYPLYDWTWGEEEDVPYSVDGDAVWQRLEGWITHRWGVRDVEWIVEGPGEFVPRLTPAELSTFEKWTGTGWEAVTLPTTPLRGFDLETGTYRLSGTVGETDAPPGVVFEAYARLFRFFEYTNASNEMAIVDFGGDGATRAGRWAARAMELSGAADLLRPWRRLR